MIDFLLICCVAYTVIDLANHFLNWLPDWAVHDEEDR